MDSGGPSELFYTLILHDVLNNLLDTGFHSSNKI